MDEKLIYNALEEAEDGLIEALGDLTDHFTIKHVNANLETVQDALEYMKQTQNV